MQKIKPVEVAILLATYNGTRFIEQQLRSLKDNVTPFTLHWLDDHSTDGTRAAVRAISLSAGIELKEWHQPQHQGVPGAFFQLMECVDADIYLFCDQDDIWQPGKIDATVENLRPDIDKPVLCFSNPLSFKNDEPENLCTIFDFLGIEVVRALQESRLLTSNPAVGNTIGFTRPLREIFLRHKDIAHTYAAMHDWWMSLIASASGTSRILLDVPTTLYRIHGNNVTGTYLGSIGIFQFAKVWRLQQHVRRWASRQAEGFCLASVTLTPGQKLDRLVATGRLVETLNRRQSVTSLVRLAFRRGLPPSKRLSAWFVAACLCSDANSK